MNPRLLAVAGPLKDSSFVLTKGEVSVGRDSSNLLSIADPSLSRRHCVLIQEEEGYRIRDLDSRNGTLVNGVAVKEALLCHGDQISVGDSTFVIHLQEEDREDGAGDRVEFDEGRTQATAQLPPQDALYLNPERILTQLPASRVARNLKVLLKFSQVVHTLRDWETLQNQILTLIFELVPAERGAILMDYKDGQFGTVFARHRFSVGAKPVRVSRTIARRVMDEAIGILGSDVGAAPGFDAESLIATNVRSLLCVPLLAAHEVKGCIYVDTTNSSSRFDDDHLQLVSAVAGIAAVALENVRRLYWLEQENRRLNTEINLDHNLVGESGPMKDIYTFMSRVAAAESTVLIEGESGTGKELLARAIHRNSPRAGRTFVPIDCASITETLAESELFGHEKGAFTGAVVQKKGRFELANGCVVFLDEIGDLSPGVQVKLLRVLQERQFTRVGGNRPISVDIRVIAATNKNLHEAVKAGLFRLDLYYRLNVVSVVMPPLRERREDIPMLVEYFLGKYSKKCKIRPKRISPEAMACLVNYDWPGNVRELENAIERALVLCLTQVIQPEDLPESILERDVPGIASAKYHAAVKQAKKQLILAALQEAEGNYTEAARLLGVHPNYLHRLIRNLDLRDAAKSIAEGRVSGKKLA